MVFPEGERGFVKTWGQRYQLQRFGLGFMLRTDMIQISPGPRGFGHAGAGGSLGVGDPDSKTGFGFTLNKMQMGLVGAPVAFEMLKAFHEAL